jgi:hypothetical protein
VASSDGTNKVVRRITLERGRMFGFGSFVFFFFLFNGQTNRLQGWETTGGVRKSFGTLATPE